MMLKKLKIRFVCAVTLISSLMLCAVLGTVIHFTRENLERESTELLEQVASDPLIPIRPGGSGSTPGLPYFTVQIDLMGAFVSAHGGYYDLSDKEALKEIISLALAEENDTGVLRQQGLRFLKSYTPLGINIVFADISSEIRTEKALITTCILIGLISFAVLFGVSVLLARRAVKPVDEAWRQQRQFVSDASHELKTPLTVIMTNAELLQEENVSPEDKKKFSANILTVSTQMRTLVERLLELARSDNGKMTDVFSDVDLTAAVNDALLPFEPVFYEKGLGLDSELEDGITVRGSDRQLRELTDILLDNARKYSSPGGTVRVGLSQNGHRCILSVESPGEEIPREELKNIFKRFYRLDEARTSSGSYGLGLSIAESITKAHGGKIWAESHGGVNTFYVQLPTM